MRPHVIILGSLLPFANVGVTSSISPILSEIGTNLTAPEAQVISSIIAVLGSFLVAAFMNKLNSNYSNAIRILDRDKKYMILVQETKDGEKQSDVNH